MMSRRELLNAFGMAWAAELLGLSPDPVAAEPPPETTRLRLMDTTSPFWTICFAPQYVAEPLLQAEGFAGVEYVKGDVKAINTYALLASGQIDITMVLGVTTIIRIDARDPVVILAGIHSGCYELFVTDRVRNLHDLRGKTIAVAGLGGGSHVILSTILAYVGINPAKDVTWAIHPFTESMELLAAGRVDAFLGFPPEPQELKARKIGRVILNTALDRPWAQYFCCVVAANREFVRAHPMATKRALRAILKGADLCALQPERSTRFLVNKGFETSEAYTLQALRDVPYRKWRDYDPEDTVRFYSLRLRDIGVITSSPQKIIAQGTNWRFFNELKKELKA